MLKVFADADTSSGSIFDNFLKIEIPGEIFSSLIVCLIIIVLSIIVAIISKHRDPLKRPKGFMSIVEYGVTFFDKFAVEMMGPAFKNMGGFVMALALYLFTSFIFGLTGLPSPMTYMAIPLSLGLVSFVMIHVTAVRYQKWKYFKRYIDPFPVFLPINLMSMWAPLLSLTLRLFGNAIAGFALMTILYSALEALNGMIFSFMGTWGGAIGTPLVTGVFHLYFDLFSGFIQTTVFISLTSIYIGQEGPEDITDVVTQQIA